MLIEHVFIKDNSILVVRKVLVATVALLACCAFLVKDVEAIDCFKCVSVNGNNPVCEDPFHNNYTSDILESPCMGGRKGRNGLFPATSCIKLSGVYVDTGETVMIRGCALDSGTLTTDTEIVRMSHCGGLHLDERYVKGCLQSCDDSDGCNSSTALPLSATLVFSTTILLLFLKGFL